MKKSNLFLLFAICGAFFMLFFIGCSQASNSGPDNPGGDDGKGFYIKNSRWQNVDIDTVKAIVSAKTGARSINNTERSAETLTDTIALVDTYNDVINDDQLFLFTEDVPVEESPFVDIYYVNEGDYADLGSYLGIERTDYIARYEHFQIEGRARGALLFVDKVPPVPIIPPETRTPYEKYSVYLVNTYGKIMGVEHCSEVFEEMKSNPLFRYPTVDDYFYTVCTGYRMELNQTVGDGRPWRMITGELYFEPVEE